MRSFDSVCSMYQTRKSSCSLRDSVFSRVSRTFFVICMVIDDAPNRKPPRCRFLRSALWNCELTQPRCLKKPLSSVVMIDPTRYGEISS